MASTSYLRAMRAKALAAGDLAQVRALDADMARSGPVPGRAFGDTRREWPTDHVRKDVWQDPEPPETTQAVELPERAVPEKPRRGRPPRPRCEHGNLVGRCVDCED